MISRAWTPPPCPRWRAIWHNGFARIDGALTTEETREAIKELDAPGGVLTGEYSGAIPYASLRRDGIAALEVTDQLPVCLA